MRTTGTNDTTPDVTVETVLVPYNAKPNRLVSYETYVDSNGALCSLSYKIRKGSELLGDILQDYQLVLMEKILQAGYIVSLPDYQGLTRDFAAGLIQGRQTLDSVVGTLNFETLGLSKNTPVVVTSYSGGAIAKGFAAELQPTYAPSINAKGFAIGGTPANITGTLLKLDLSTVAGFDISGLTGIAYSNPPLLEWLEPRLTTKGRQAVNFARSHCQTELVLRYPFSHIISEDIVRGGTHLLEEPIVYKVLNQYVMGIKKQHTPKAPVLMFHGKNDEVIPYDDALVAAKRWAQNGANVVFQTQTLPILGHALTQLVNVPNVLFFIEDRFANKPFPKGFTHQSVRDPLENRCVQQQGLEDIVDVIRSIVGTKIGPNDRIIEQYIRDHAHNQTTSS
ncbi:hypothetical protein MYAM1_000009 [Malassezia yamatoensis]|uniref:triacylglycerol lipase n=1 Tax=Malassezia yamatoensis TaxID=253288 RepID=A0AAJ6CFM4_9BASI|nr:hypothetical protein MYAM1_000009 [Malassezia yamatoensis]